MSSSNYISDKVYYDKSKQIVYLSDYSISYKSKMNFKLVKSLIIFDYESM